MRIEPKPPIKTNWNLFAIVAIVAIILAVGGILLLKVAQPSPLNIENRRAVSEEKMRECTQGTECILVQYGWCKTVSSINKKYETEWYALDKDRTEIARQVRRTCEPVRSEDLNVDNFVSRCENLKCVATKKLDIGHSLPIDIQGWQTYRNSEFGFEVKYPPQWQFSRRKTNEFLFSDPDVLNSNQYLIPSGFDVSVGSKSTLNSIYDSSKTNACRKVIQLSNHNALRCDVQGSVYVETEHDGKFYFLRVDGEKASRRVVLFDAFLATFRFTKQHTLFDVDTWKVYRNEKYQFEFRYPEAFHEDDGYANTVESVVLTSGEHGLSILVGIETKYSALDDYLQELESIRATADEGDPSVYVLRKQEIQIVEKPGFRQEIIPAAAPDVGIVENFIEGSPELIISISIRRGIGQQEEERGTAFDLLRKLNTQILSTFRFIEK